PCKDDPSDKADSVDMVITVPAGLVVASNGLLDRTAAGNDGTTTYYWKERYPIATYLVSIAIYPYTVWDDTYVGLDTTESMLLQFFSYPDHINQLENNYLRTKDMIHAFAQRYGEYPFINEKYGHAEFGWGGGMEHQTITSVGGWGLDLLSHELAHQWWGDMVTCTDFHHIWLNEGFATYSQAIWWESQDGPTGYHSFINTRRYYGAGTVYVEEPTSVGAIFDYNLSYAKGAWVLHMLRHVVGDSTFFEILQTYGSDPQFRYNSATTEQFRDVCESVSGMDLHPFFQQWIYESYYPNYTVGYFQSGDTLHVEIGQTSTGGTIFTMPIDLEIHGIDSVFTTVVQNSTSSETYAIPLPPAFQVINVILDPEQWILRHVQYVPMNSDDEPLPGEWSLKPAYPNPFNSRVSFPYALRNRAEVDFTIFNLAGHEIASSTFVKPAGRYEFHWNGRDSWGRQVSGGIYLVRFRAGNYSQTEKVVFLK
ncbi:MAG: T9SS type A sorting domain-containing protein, partial [FCB group bacterium]|nr:T9SS type A sorting domain-containing protein [FCB group bacterium]